MSSPPAGVALGPRSPSRVGARLPGLLPDAHAGLLGFAVVSLVASVNGGYFPTSWGWTTMALAWAAALAILLRKKLRLARIELLALGGMAGLAVWTALSALWSPSLGATALELERTMMYAMALLAALVVVRSGSYRSLLTGTWAAIALVSCYSLATKLVPSGFLIVHAVAGNRLSEPVGYWNSLGVLCALGVLLALGLVAHGRALVVRAAAAASLPVLTLTLYFTFSRGSLIAFGLGLATAVALDPRRLKLIVALLLAGPWPVAAAAIAARSAALTRTDATATAATDAGRRLLLVLAVVVVAAACSALLLAALERRVRPSASVRRGFSAALAGAVALALLAVFVRFGDPVTLARKGYRAFNSPPVAQQPDLNRRLLSFSGSWRMDLWRAAGREWLDRPVLGAGGGTYEQIWLERRHVPTKVVNAHNVYAETLAELGPVGLAFLLTALGAPLVAAVRARRSTLVPPAAAAYVAFLAHAGVDWDWEVPGLTLAALFIAGALLAAGRRSSRALVSLSTRSRSIGVALVVALACVASVGLVGNRALAASSQAVEAQQWREAEQQARRAMRWAPWSAQPWETLGESQLLRGELSKARASFREGIAKDRRNWQLWLDLAFASEGKARVRAAREALRLNPLSLEIAQVRPALGLKEAKAP